MRRTFAILALTAGLGLPLAAAAEPLDLGAMSDADRAAFREEVRTFLLDNPEVILEAIQLLEERRAAQAEASDREVIEQHADQLFDDGFSYVMGNPDGDVTVVEFLDYRCGYCKKAHPAVAKMLEDDPDVRLVVKEFPILGPESVTAGKLALAALELDRSRFGPLHDALMTHQGNLTEQAAYDIAEDAGYDMDELRELAASTEVDDRLQQNYQLARSLGLQGTPAFVVGDEVIRGFIPAEELMAAVRDARASAN